MRWRWFPIAAVLVLVPGAVLAEVRPGDVREVQARAGVPLREGAAALSKMVRLLPYQARVTVQEVKGSYARVVVSSDGATGWTRANDLVAPGTLTGGAPSGNATVASSADISAAGRQFDESIERQYRASRAELDAAYRALDAIEAKTPPPGDPAVRAFIEEGRLGRPEVEEARLGR
jgi:hypothetical protein